MPTSASTFDFARDRSYEPGAMWLAKLDDGPEIFHTLQGEGVSAGLPAVFIRASRCNLHCRWCDTDYTWNFEGTPWQHDRHTKHRRADLSVELEAAELVPLVTRFSTRRVVLTGGEPMLQQPAWLELIRLLRDRDPRYLFEVESNATRPPEPEFEAAVDQFNLSPKLANAGMPASLRLVPAVLDHFARSPKAWFKFVARGPADLGEIDDLVARFGIPTERVLLMPEGRSAAELDRHGAALAEPCLARGWRFCDRLHVRLWGDRRGV